MRWGGIPFLFDKDMFGSSRWGMFEGIKCRIPDKTADYLTQHYGDEWMYIPPHSEHESHDAIYSLTTDYKTIENDYLRYLDIDVIRKSIIKRKKFFLKNMENRLEEKDKVVNSICLFTKLHIEKTVENCGFDIQEALEEGEFEKLNELFMEFYDKQLSRLIIGREDYIGAYRFNNPGYCGANDEIIYVAVMVLIHTNRIAKGARLLDVREQNEGPLTEKLKLARKLVNDIRKAVSDFDLGMKEESFEQIKLLHKEYPYNDSINMIYISQLLDRGEMVEAEAAATFALSIFPENGVYDKYIGDCHFENNLWKAIEIYGNAIDKTKNGSVKLDISEKLISKKRELLFEIEKNNDLDKADLLFKLEPNDIDIVKVRYDVLLEYSESFDLNKIIREISWQLLKFDKSEKIQAVLSRAYEIRGETPEIAKLRVEMSMASTAEEYHKIKDAAISICSIAPSINAYTLLRDIYNLLGLAEEAEDASNRLQEMEDAMWEEMWDEMGDEINE